MVKTYREIQKGEQAQVWAVIVAYIIATIGLSLVILALSGIAGLLLSLI